MSTPGLAFPESITIDHASGAKRLAHIHAQSEANRLGVRVFMQIDHAYGDEIFVRLSVGPLAMARAPFYTFYPQEVTV